MATNKLIDGLKLSETAITGKCKDCILGHQTCHLFDGEMVKELDPLDLVSFNLWGPSRVQSAGGKIYLMIIVDARTSYKYSAYLWDKSDAITLASFEIFHTTAETLTRKRIHWLCTDWAFDSTAWKEYCQTHRIIHELTAPYSSAQNGLATTMDDVCTLLHDSGLNHSFWAEAAAYSIDTCNLIPSCCHPGQIPLGSLGSGKMFCTCMFLVWSAGQKFLLGLDDLSLIHTVLRVISSDILLAEETTRSKMSCLTKFLCHTMLFLRRVSLIGHQWVWGRTYQSLTQTQYKVIHLLIPELTQVMLMLPIKVPPITVTMFPIRMFPIRTLPIMITSLSQTLPLSPLSLWNNDDPIEWLILHKLDSNPWNTRNMKLLGKTKARTVLGHDWQ